MLNGRKIDSGNDSTNNQAETIIYNSGLSYSDAREIAIDVFKANIIQLSESAASLALERASELTEKFLNALQTEAPAAISEFGTPAMQDTLFQAQKEYAINGDNEVADMLVDMLVQRAKSPVRNRLRLALDESLKVAPKLTIAQIDLLTLAHFTYRVKLMSVLNFDALVFILTGHFRILDHIDENQINADLSFLEYYGLGKISIGEHGNLSQSCITEYPALFNKGFTTEECSVNELSFDAIFIPCFHDLTKLQFRFETKEILINELRARNLTEERINFIASFFDTKLFTQHEAQEKLIERIPNFGKLISIFNNTSFKSFDISSVGMAIALSNYHRRYNEKNDISIWIN